MNHLYLFHNTQENSTYTQQLVHLFSSYSKVKVHWIQCLSNQYQEFTIVEENENLQCVSIPTPQDYTDSIENREKYAKWVVHFVSEIIDTTENVVFHFVSTWGVSIAKLLKQNYHYPQVGTIEHIENSEVKEFCQTVDKIIVVSNSIKQQLCTQYSIDTNKITLIQNGIDSSKLNFVSDKTALRHDLGFCESEKILLLINTSNNGEGVRLVIGAFQKVIKQIPNVRLLIVGEENSLNYSSECTNCWAKVSFASKVNEDTLQNFYQIADIALLPSLQQYSTAIVLNMMAHQSPIIANHVEGLDEIITTHTNGLLIQPEQNQWTEQILNVLENNTLAKHLGTQAQKTVNSKFTIQEMFTKTKLVYNFEQ